LKATSQGRIFHAGQCNVTPISREHCSRLQQSRYSGGLNDPFCCIHYSIDSKCFSTCRKTHKIAHSCGGISTPI